MALSSTALGQWVEQGQPVPGIGKLVLHCGLWIHGWPVVDLIPPEMELMACAGIRAESMAPLHLVLEEQEMHLLWPLKLLSLLGLVAVDQGM
jgi:hypothetical protein